MRIFGLLFSLLTFNLFGVDNFESAMNKLIADRAGKYLVDYTLKNEDIDNYFSNVFPKYLDEKTEKFKLLLKICGRKSYLGEVMDPIRHIVLDYIINEDDKKLYRIFDRLVFDMRKNNDDFRIKIGYALLDNLKFYSMAKLYYIKEVIEYAKHVVNDTNIKKYIDSEIFDRKYKFQSSKIFIRDNDYILKKSIISEIGGEILIETDCIYVEESIFEYADKLKNIMLSLPEYKVHVHVYDENTNYKKEMDMDEFQKYFKPNLARLNITKFNDDAAKEESESSKLFKERQELNRKMQEEKSYNQIMKKSQEKREIRMQLCKKVSKGEITEEELKEELAKIK